MAAEVTSESPEPETFTEVFEPFTRVQQRAFERQLARGASPAAACAALRVPLESMWATVDADDQFVQRCQRVLETLNENVKAAIYQAAMQGKVTAQSNWLKLMQSEAAQEERASRQQAATPELEAAARQRALKLGELFRSWDEQLAKESIIPPDESTTESARPLQP